MIFDYQTNDWMEEVSPHQWWPLRDPRIKPDWIKPQAVEIEKGLLRARRRASRIIRRAGLDAESATHVVFQDGGGHWWAFVPDDQDALPATPAQVERYKISPNSGTKLSSVEYWLVTPGYSECSDLPAALSEFLGGKSGPFDWALSVLCLCESFPEALHADGYRMLNFQDGLEIGLSLGRFTDFEPFTPSPRKIALWRLIKEWLLQQENLSNRQTALGLLAARDKDTPFGEDLRSLGLAADLTTVEKTVAKLRREL